MATIRKRNNKYQFQVSIKGLSTSATLISLDNARRWAKQKELEIELNEKHDLGTKTYSNRGVILYENYF